MFKGIFQRLLITYIALVAIIILSLGLMFTTFLNSYHTERAQKNLSKQNAVVMQMVDQYQKGDLSFEELKKHVDSIAAATDTLIFVRRFDNKIKEVLESEQMQNFALKEDIQKILNGETVVKTRHVSNAFKEQVMFIGSPIVQNHQVQGLVLHFAHLDDLNKTIKDVNILVWSTAFIILIISSMLIYFISNRISRPIRKVKEAAVIIAEGNFDIVLEERGDDELKQLVRAFNDMKNRLREVEKMRQELIANVSHELRTPLTSIRGFIHGMADGIIPREQYGKYHHVILKEIERLTSLISDLLDIAKFQTGNIKLTKSSCDIKEIASEVAEALLVQAQSKEINISVMDEREAVYANVDHDRIKQVFINIINNAIQYTSKGGQVTVDIKPADQELHIIVKDNGIGIPENELIYIFEKFHRVDKSRETATGGTGLGLSIVKHIVELHGGTIKAESQVEIGTTIMITIPAK